MSVGIGAHPLVLEVLALQGASDVIKCIGRSSGWREFTADAGDIDAITNHIKAGYEIHVDLIVLIYRFAIKN